MGNGFGKSDNRNKPQYIIVHHSATPVNGRNYPALWWATAFHKYTMRRFGAVCPYHFIVAPDGSVARGRRETATGRHTARFNRRSLGVCLVGHFDKETPTKWQMTSLRVLLLDLINAYGIVEANILGHREANVLSFGVPKKTCPGRRVDMDELRREISTEHMMRREGIV